ncbi:hypothetical protein EXIGLDRAFT_602781 [Exidia glandulosa HHB12029]|uniref:CwfJ C-terminus 1-domain-containing protein-like protein n=1 Tax=Exidia glandulosa HHB12029 TaxID=1314781 RepID=A0A165P059_EXIGL|nr:hypothetical protein EXIGLDRAFT_602781 [Exidia glandulosa HHB12029]
MPKHKRREEKEEKKSRKKARVESDDDEWEESNVDISTSAATSAPAPAPTKSAIEREEWMQPPPSSSRVSGLSRSDDVTDGYGDEDAAPRARGSEVDFFTSMGTERKRKEKTMAPNPEDLVGRSSRELNPYYRNPEAAPEETPKRVSTPGGPGSQWRMMKLRRVYEAAEDENRPVEDVALDRYGSLEAFNEAVEERRILDEKAGKKGSRTSTPSAAPSTAPRRFMFTEMQEPGSGASSRSASFRRPTDDSSRPTTPSIRPPLPQRGSNTPSAMAVPMVHSPAAQPLPSAKGVPSQSELNQMQARVLKAKLLGDPGAEAMEQEYEEMRDRAESAPRVAVLPTHDVRGQVYDVGLGRDDAHKAGNRKSKLTSEEDEKDIGVLDMLRQERFGAGRADQKDMDAQLTRAIMSDGKFEANLEYMDDNADRLGRKKMKSDAMKRMFAIQDHARTQRVLASCQFCAGDDDTLPKVAVVALGTRCYLACTTLEELVPGHCIIVPLQHHLAMLEGDDDLWEEVRNFMKCLMRMFAEEDKGVVFFETVISLKKQQHTFIECVPVPWSIFEDVPAYFKEAILSSESEWSQHRKVIDFSARPGGFRRAMVPNLPYFAIQWDYKGEKGYGHVIEGVSDAGGAGDDPDGAVDENMGNSGKFPRYFAAEIIGNLLDLPPRLWRHPKRVDAVQNKQRVQTFKKKYDKFDWTPMLAQS